jgi:hypothetical protein
MIAPYGSVLLIPHTPNHRSAIPQQALDAAHGQTVALCRSSANTRDLKFCTTYFVHALRRKARTSAWQQCSPNPIRRLARTTREIMPLLSDLTFRSCRTLDTVVS